MTGLRRVVLWIFFVCGGFALALAPVFAQTQAILPNGMTQFSDGNGAPYAGGHVYMYVPFTTTPKTTYQDPNGTTPNQNPITLDTNGRGIIWGSGEYRQVLQDVNGVVVWDQLTLAPGTTTTTGSPVLWYGTAQGTANSIALTGSTAFAKIDGQVIGFLASASNTASATINVNGTGAVLVQKDDPIVGLTALVGGEIVVGASQGALELAVYSVTSNSFNLVATNVVVDPTVNSDPTSLTVYNPLVPYTSTTTYGGLFQGASDTKRSLGALPTYSTNGIFAEDVQTNTSTNVTIAALTGLGVLNATGGYARGVFGKCYQFSIGSCLSGVFSSYNEYVDATNAYPPVGGFPDSATEPVGVEVIALGGFVSKVGVWISGQVSNNGTTKYGYQIGEYVGLNAAEAFGLLVDASASVGPTIGAEFNSTGGATQVGVEVSAVAAPSSGFEFFVANEPTLGVVFSVGYLGNIFTNGNLTVSSAASTAGSGEISFGSTIAAASNCNVASPTPAGCLVLNVAGTTRYAPLY